MKWFGKKQSEVITIDPARAVTVGKYTIRELPAEDFFAACESLGGLGGFVVEEMLTLDAVSGESFGGIITRLFSAGVKSRQCIFEWLAGVSSIPEEDIKKMTITSLAKVAAAVFEVYRFDDFFALASLVVQSVWRGMQTVLNENAGSTKDSPSS